MLHYRELITYKCKDKGPILNSLLNEEENMDLIEKINEAIENEDFETADILTKKLYELEFKDQNIHYSDDFAKKIILSKGKKNMNNKFRKLAVAASCALIVGVTGISVNAATDGEALNNVKTFIKNIGGAQIEVKQYEDKDGKHSEYEIYDFKVKQNEKSGDVEVTIEDKDKTTTYKSTIETTSDNTK